MRDSGQVIYETEFRRLHPNTSMPKPLTEEVINDFGGDVVFEGAQSTGGTVYQYSQQDGVELVNGKWFTKYILAPNFTDYTDDEGVLHTAEAQEVAYKAVKDEAQAKSVRDTRNKMLSDCDWTQLADSTADKATWATYRQALRDLPMQTGFPFDVIYPDAP